MEDDDKFIYSSSDGLSLVDESDKSKENKKDEE